MIKCWWLLVLFTGIVTVHGQSSGCPSRCRCAGVSIICSRLSLTHVPIVRNAIQIYDLSNNRIAHVRASTFSNLYSLKTLYLNNNNLTSLQADTFTGLDQLVELILHDNAITTIDVDAFRSLRNLKHLYLQKNKLRQIEPQTFVGLNLEKLYLNVNMLTQFTEQVFAADWYNSLRVLNLEKNKLNCDCDLYWLWTRAKSGLTSSSDRDTQLDLKAYCYYPTNIQNRRLTSLIKEDLRCVEPVIVESPRDVEARPGEEFVQFSCRSVGHPKPQVEWFKNGVKINNDQKYSLLNDGSALLIRDIDQNDAGNYECVARSVVGETRSVARLTFNQNGDQELEFNERGYQYDVSDFEVNEQINEQRTETDDGLKFVQMPQDLAINEGQNAKFICRTNDRSNRISWLKDGEQINDQHSRVYVHPSGDLEIKGIRVEDEGFYVCSISRGSNTKYAQAELIVNVPVILIKKPVDQEVIEGNIVEFYCSVSGKPEPSITWTKNGRPIKRNSNEDEELDQTHYELYQNDQLLRINNVRRQMDEGVYSCVANNSVNRLTTYARLTINPPITPYFTIMQQNISVFEDHPIRLECFANGDPKPQVLWYKNGQRIITDSRVHFDSFGYLAVTQVRVSDAGEYICRAENVGGFAIHKFFLSVKDIYGTVISNSIINEAIDAAKNDIKLQLQNTLNSLNDKRRPKTASDLLALLRFPKDKTLNLVLSEEIYERALDIVFRYANNITFNLTKQDYITQEVLTFRQLQRISDLSGCSRYKQKVDCSKRCLNYRSFDGTCNNLNNARLGSANTALRRLVPAEYQNGFSTPRGWNKSLLYNGYMLPNARDVSTSIISTKKITEDRKFSLMLMQWGQFVDHDMDHTVMALSLNRFSNGIACRDSCTNDQPCFPIEVMPNDTLREHLPGRCMEFVRSSAICGSGETSLLVNKIHQREQINQLTAFIDASNVYGSNDQDAFDIRERTVNTGKLKVHVTPRYRKGLLPFNFDTNMDCQRDNTTTVGCFMAGDYRANEQLALLAFHNLWVRQHNTIVDKLAAVNPHWQPEQLYQEARKIVGAQMQIITYDAWLPHILGPIGMQKLGKYERYDETVSPTISNEFATAAFRFGHALIQPFTFRLNETFQPIPEGNLLLRDSFFAPQRFYYEGGMDPLLRGLYGVPAKLKMPREIMNSELTEKLFHITRIISQDLAALNIQRGRDHGLPGYAAYRRYCNMTDVRDFDDLKNEIKSQEVRDILKRLYGDVRNIDLWPAGILEDTVEGSKLGPLFMCIIVDQFRTLRDGDRFWHEKPGVFTPAQLRELKKTSLAKIICENGDNIEHVQKDVFLNAKYPSQMSRCSQLPDLNFEPWRNCCRENPVGLCGEPAYFYVPFESASRRKRSADDQN